MPNDNSGHMEVWVEEVGTGHLQSDRHALARWFYGNRGKSKKIMWGWKESQIECCYTESHGVRFFPFSVQTPISTLLVLQKRTK